MWEMHIPIPENVFNEMLKIVSDKRVKCILNGSVEHYCAMMPKVDFHYLLLNKSIMKSMKLKLGDAISVELFKPNLKYGIPICREFEEVLENDIEGSDYFHKLGMGAQRTLINVINKYKNPQLRIDRSIILLRHLVLRNGNLDFKILNANFKESL